MLSMVRSYQTSIVNLKFFIFLCFVFWEEGESYFLAVYFDNLSVANISDQNKWFSLNNRFSFRHKWYNYLMKEW